MILWPPGPRTPCDHAMPLAFARVRQLSVILTGGVDLSESTPSVAQIAQGGKDIILGLLILGTIVAYGRRDAAGA